MNHTERLGLFVNSSDGAFGKSQRAWWGIHCCMELSNQCEIFTQGRCRGLPARGGRRGEDAICHMMAMRLEGWNLRCY